MLQRHQVLMSDWLIEYWQFIAEKFDFSLSEMLRLALCQHILDVIPIAFPRYKSGLDKAMFKKIVQKRKIDENLSAEDLHRFISQLYFEARKATEFWMREDSKNKRKSILRLLENCPFKTPLSDCPVKKLRRLPSIKRFKIVKSMSQQELDRIVWHHKGCSKERKNST